MDRSSGGKGNDDETSMSEENMDRTAQAGMEGAFDADPGMDPDRRQARQDALDAFGGSEDTSSDTNSSDQQSGT
jgi:hypothetical protein